MQDSPFSRITRTSRRLNLALFGVLPIALVLISAILWSWQRLIKQEEESCCWTSRCSWATSRPKSASCRAFAPRTRCCRVRHPARTSRGTRPRRPSARARHSTRAAGRCFQRPSPYRACQPTARATRRNCQPWAATCRPTTPPIGRPPTIRGGGLPGQCQRQRQHQRAGARHAVQLPPAQPEHLPDLGRRHPRADRTEPHRRTAPDRPACARRPARTHAGPVVHRAGQPEPHHRPARRLPSGVWRAEAGSRPMSIATLLHRDRINIFDRILPSGLYEFWLTRNDAGILLGEGPDAQEPGLHTADGLCSRSSTTRAHGPPTTASATAASSRTICGCRSASRCCCC